jgi:hypothetical protein
MIPFMRSVGCRGVLFVVMCVCVCVCVCVLPLYRG